MRQEAGLPLNQSNESIQVNQSDKKLRNQYGLSDEEFKLLREKEYPALRDSAASPPPPLSTINSFSSTLARTLYSNPHSRSHSSQQTTQEIDSIRTIVLSDLFGLTTVQDRRNWDLIFTSGATDACKQLAQSFPWSKESHFRYLKESHTSLVGIRGVALAQNAIVDALDVNDTSWIDNEVPSLFAYPAQCNATGARLGLKYGSQIKSLHPSTFVLLDAAAYLSTSPLQLSSFPFNLAPDFVVCSFYKLFGYPTGLGCLLVKRSSASILRFPDYFGGGTISSLSVSGPNFWHHSRLSSSLQNASTSQSQDYSIIHDSFEHGTLPFLNIIALGHALETHKRLYKSHSDVSNHTFTLAQFALEEMSKLRHANGSVIFKHHLAFSNYPKELLESQPFGPMIGFTLLDSLGNSIGHVHLDRLATLNGIQLRSGGLCNTGVLDSVLDLNDNDREIDYQKGRVCWDDEEFGGESGKKPLGISRISFGAMNSREDVQIWITFLKKYFVVPVDYSNSEEKSNLGSKNIDISREPPDCYLSGLMLYPIKSCGAQRLSTPFTSHTPSNLSSAALGWELTPTGLKYDREWMLIHALTSKILSQKQFPRMALVRPKINLEKGTLEIYAGKDKWEIDLLDDESTEEEYISIRGDFVLASKGSTSEFNKKALLAIDEGLSEFLGVPCRLMRFRGGETGTTRHAHFDSNSSTSTISQPITVVPILLSNESPFLLISTASVDQVSEWIQEDYTELEEEEVGKGKSTPSSSISLDCFRANFIFSSKDSSDPSLETERMSPFLEDQVDFIKIGSETFSVLAKCRRCLMICVNQNTGVREKEPFSTLARHRKSSKGRIEFGVHLIWRKELSTSDSFVGSRVREGDRVEFGFV